METSWKRAWPPEQELHNDTCLRVAIVVIKHHNKMLFGEEQVYFMLEPSGYTSSLKEDIEGPKCSNLKAESEANYKPHKNVAWHLQIHLE